MNAPKPPGRPTLTPGERVTRIQVSLDPQTIALAKALGAGNVSLGIRLALAASARLPAAA